MYVTDFKTLIGKLENTNEINANLSKASTTTRYESISSHM